MTYGEQKSEQTEFSPLFRSFTLSRTSHFNPVRHSFRCEGNVLYMLMKGMLRGQSAQTGQKPE